MKIELNLTMNNEGINYITFTKYFQEGARPGNFPQTTKKAIKLIIEELQEMIKEKSVVVERQCYTCDNYVIPSGECKEHHTFKESHDTCPVWIPIKKCCTCHNYHKPTSICQDYSERENENVKVNPEHTCLSWTPIIPMEKN